MHVALIVAIIAAWFAVAVATGVLIGQALKKLGNGDSDA